MIHVYEMVTSCHCVAAILVLHAVDGTVGTELTIVMHSLGKLNEFIT